MNSPGFFTVTSFEDRTVAEIVYKGGGDAAKSFFSPPKSPTTAFRSTKSAKEDKKA
jgi:hypothetical protein